MSPQDLNILVPVLPPKRCQCGSIWWYIGWFRSAWVDVNVISRGQGFFKLRQRIDPPRRYGDISTYVYEAIVFKLCF